MAACDHALTVEELESIYFKYTNSEIPYRILGFENIFEFLYLIPEITFVWNQEAFTLFFSLQKAEFQNLLNKFILTQ